MRAIDLYSGVGGWSLGLRMAGFEMAGSYEWWDQANRTYAINFAEAPTAADVRALPLEVYPKDIDVVVGSPPCTQFSFANRGGNGDIADGLKDIYKFLEVVEYVRPRYWVMENVPRVAGILERELSLHGKLRRFSDLVSVIAVVDMSQYGLPQRRRRMVAGSFPFDLLQRYRRNVETRTLGQVITALESDPAVDPLYGFELRREQLRDHLREPPLDEEEARLNRDAKEYHHYCNVMAFPDPLTRPARTVTALCTRVSRESIVVKDENGQLRRLTVRERASLQGFPITFQFHGDSYSDNLKLVGNAIPPLFVYYVGKSILDTPAGQLAEAGEIHYRHPLPENLPPEIEPKPPRGRFGESRRFRTVIPRLRFGSGVRFDLTNEFGDEGVSWQVTFFYGTSKDIHTVAPGRVLLDLVSRWPSCRCVLHGLWTAAARMTKEMGELSPDALQAVWSRRRKGLHPHQLADRLGEIAEELHRLIPGDEDRERVERMTLWWLGTQRPEARRYLTNSPKMKKIASWILIGLVVGSWVNSESGLCRVKKCALASTG